MGTDRVDEVMADVPREGFLPRRLRSQAGHDGPLPIGHGQTSSQPRTVADMLRLLGVRPGDRVLDVGSGSGWTTALLARLTGPTGEVHGVEVVPELAQWGSDNLARAGFGWASIELAREGVLGLPEHAPYDRVLVSADGGELPSVLVEQLATPGRMVVPVSGRMLVVERDAHGTHQRAHGHYRFVPLVRP